MEKLLERFPVLLSSKGTGLALRVKAFIPLLLGLAGLAGFGLDAGSLEEAADQLEVAVSAAFTLVGAFTWFVGWSRKKAYQKLGQGKYAK